MKNKETERTELIRELNLKHKRFQFWARFWSGIYHSTLYGSIIFSITSALILNLSILHAWQYSSDFLTFLSISSATLITISAIGRFHQRWRTHRYSRICVEQLLIKMQSPEVEISNIRHALINLLKKHNGEISGYGN
jgi:hypothetical protein